MPIACDGHVSRLRSHFLPGPLHLLPSLLRYAPLSLDERLGVMRVALGFYGRARSDVGFADWLISRGQDEETIEVLWNPIAVAALNAPASEVSQAAARKVFRDAFFRPGGADIGLFNAPIRRVADQAAEYNPRARTAKFGPAWGFDSVTIESRRATGIVLRGGEAIEGRCSCLCRAGARGATRPRRRGFALRRRGVERTGRSRAGRRIAVGADRQPASLVRSSSARRAVFSCRSTPVSRPSSATRPMPSEPKSGLTVSQSGRGTLDGKDRRRDSRRAPRRSANSSSGRSRRRPGSRTCRPVSTCHVRPVSRERSTPSRGGDRGRRPSFLPATGPRPDGRRRSRVQFDPGISAAAHLELDAEADALLD